MLALVGVQKCEKPKLQDRILGKFQPYTVEDRYMLGMGIKRINLNKYENMKIKFERRCAEKLARSIELRESSFVLFSREFSQKDVFISAKKPNAEYLYVCAAGAVGQKVSENKDMNTAAFFANSIGQWEEKSLLKLAASYRYLILVTGRDSSAICSSLRSRFGIAVISNPSDRQIEMVDFAAVLSPMPQKISFHSRTVIFVPKNECQKAVTGGQRISGIEFKFPKNRISDVPDGFDMAPIVSEAIRYGFFSPDEIAVSGFRLDNHEYNYYNNENLK